MYLKAGKKFSCTYDHLKLKFYSSFNALYSRSKSSNSELVSVTLVKSFCLPALLYGIEVTDPSKSVLRMLNNLINRGVYRICNVSDKDSIADIRHFVGLQDIEVLYKQRLANFVIRTSTLEHPVLQSFNSECIFNLLLLCVCAAFGELKFLISYTRSIVTKSLSPAVSEILGHKHIWVMTLTFQGHLTSSVT